MSSQTATRSGPSFMVLPFPEAFTTFPFSIYLRLNFTFRNISHKFSAINVIGVRYKSTLVIYKEEIARDKKICRAGLMGGIAIDSIQEMSMSDMRQRKKRMSTTYEVVSTGDERTPISQPYCLGQELERPDAEQGHAVAILGATVLSLSNFSLFRLKACCRQSSRLLHAWCSGNRCYNAS